MKLQKSSIRRIAARQLGAASLAAMLAAGIFLATAPAARAQDTATLPTQNVSITLSDAPVRTALDGLFKSTNLNYTIDPAIQEDVTVTLHDVPFEVALKAILRSSTPELRYSVSDGIYKIFAPSPDEAGQSALTPGAPTQPTYPGIAGGGNPSGGTGPGANIGTNTSATDTQQVVLIPLIYVPAAVLNFVTGPIQQIPVQAYTPGATSNGTGGTNGTTGGIGGIGGSSGGYGSSLGGVSSGIGGIGGISGGIGGGISGGYGR